jgi:uncharacterized integral membrane protein
MVVVLMFLVAIGLVVFGYENRATSVSLTFWNWTWSSVPLWYPVGAGAVVTFLISLGRMLRQGARSRSQLQWLRQHEAVIGEHDEAIADLRWDMRALREEQSRGPGAPV